jgi:hypothetical protein
MRSAFAALSFAVVAQASDNPFGYSNDVGITSQGEWELQQSITMRSGMDQGSGFDGAYRGLDFVSQLEWGLSDRAHLDFQSCESHLRTRGFRFDGLNIEYKRQLRDGAGGTWGAAWAAALGYSQLDAADGGLRTETRCAVRLLLQKEFGGRSAWCYVSNFSSGLAHNPAGTTGQIEWSQGIAYRADDHRTFGLEAVADGAWSCFRTFENSSLRLGPTFGYKTGQFSATITYLWQVSGAPATQGGLNLRDTSRSEARLLLNYGF